MSLCFIETLLLLFQCLLFFVVVWFLCDCVRWKRMVCASMFEIWNWFDMRQLLQNRFFRDDTTKLTSIWKIFFITHLFLNVVKTVTLTVYRTIPLFLFYTDSSGLCSVIVSFMPWHISNRIYIDCHWWLFYRITQKWGYPCDIGGI